MLKLKQLLIIFSLSLLLTQQVTITAAASCVEKSGADVEEIDSENYGKALLSEDECEALIEILFEDEDGDFDILGEDWDVYAEAYGDCHVALGEGNKYLTDEEEEICLTVGKCYGGGSDASVLKWGVLQIVLLFVCVSSLL
ncbi:hypothetical protein PPERSA_07728 [Pseudocohnilembus persalinus]|uniref:Transmembrane protein n=1 Tax=Pseudocohnilembus persalinus TaxID=266149 RepID=A0A0V0R9S6_PSEPJ|nr:hypothetical protein PPERSA_07728 [Pseudocohnilembus persalinus]|eukprot:KRX11203.1 hypothetical protein PPERSA_07728 [Pseudocohnilembus persalinus]